MFTSYRDLKKKKFRTLNAEQYSLIKVEGIIKLANITKLMEDLDADIGGRIDNLIKVKFGMTGQTGRSNLSYYSRIKQQWEEDTRNLARLSDMQRWLNGALSEKKKFDNILAEYESRKPTIDKDYKWIVDQRFKLDLQTNKTNHEQFKNDVFNSAEESYKKIGRSRSTLNTYKTNMETDLSTLQNWVERYRLLIRNSLDNNVDILTDEIATNETGTYSATWLNTLEGNKNASWTHENHISSSKLFRFVERKGINSSSDRTNKLKQRAFMQSVNNNDNDINYSINNNGIIDKYNKQSDKIIFKKSYNAMDETCRKNDHIATDLNDIIISKVDMSSNYLLNNGNQNNLTQVDFNINGKKTAIGLLAKTPLREFSKKKINFRKMSLTKVKRNLLDCKIIENQPATPIVHSDLDDRELHEHYFPTYGKKYGLYIHKHETNPHNSKEIPAINFQYFTYRFAKNPGL
jgi:hypothetical protein